MKKLLVLMASCFLGVSVCLADSHDDAVLKAQTLKKAGKYEEAAQVHPRNLCKAMYYWNAACQAVGHRDENNDWAINASLTDAQKSEGKRLLALASTFLADTSQDGTVDEGCKGVNADVLASLIDAVAKNIDLK